MEQPVVLIIDDDPDVAEVLSAYITDLGYETHIAESSSKGLELMKENDYFAVFSDWKMPDIKGDEVHRRLKTFKPELAQRFVLITGAVVDEDTEAKLLSTGALFLKKPFRLEQIRETLDGFKR